MGNEGSSQAYFRKMAREARQRRSWSQADVAKRLAENGVNNMHPTTVAKIEAGDREIKLDEADALANLFGLSLEAMLGKQTPDEGGLTFALANVSSYAAITVRNTATARQNANDLEEILEDIDQRFERSVVSDLIALAREGAQHLDFARSVYDRLDTAATQAIVGTSQEGLR